MRSEAMPDLPEREHIPWEMLVKDDLGTVALWCPEAAASGKALMSVRIQRDHNTAPDHPQDVAEVVLDDVQFRHHAGCLPRRVVICLDMDQAHQLGLILLKAARTNLRAVWVAEQRREEGGDPAEN
jgi:hypothetical protein